MSLRSRYTRIGMALATGSLVALAGAAPALADGDGGSGSGDHQQWSNGADGHQWSDGGDGGGDGREQGAGGDGGGQSWSNGDGGGGDGGGNQNWDNGGGGGNSWDNGGGGGNQNWNNGGGGGDGREPANVNGNGNGNGNGQNNPRLYQGRVTAHGGLALRSSPTRGSQLIRVARQGEIVSIFCKTPGETVDGNPNWYLLTDGTWAWGAARYIDNIGPAPRWC
ncbi:SH3 domain-containing protein [Streptomyces sp. NBC_00659]|uniref:SH3 domain-containing protein n=1 Tax=Streptomyces sp. NBC_00659 TaxID=2903669 RepID=UPI002E2F7CFB|nr:SH3 domain-containing protein [Streptomyces sp. NBC_00659]